jgi:hypothetical protein
LWTYEGQLVWARFGAMLLANSIVTAAIGLALTSERDLPNLVRTMSGVGLAFCLLWAGLIRRGFEYHGYWIRWARELEKDLPQVNIASQGKKFSAGQDAKPSEDGNNARLSCFGRMPSQVAGYVVILGFMAIYTVAIWLARG